MLGPDQPVMLYMLDISLAAEALNGVKMELIDVAFPLLKGVVATTVVVEACTGVNIAAMVGGFPRKEGMERKDVIYKKVSVYKAQASALEQYVAKDYKDGLDDSYWNFYNIAPRQGFSMLQIEIKEFGHMVAAKTAFGGYFIGNLSQIYAYLGDGRVFEFCPQVVLLLQMLPH